MDNQSLLIETKASFTWYYLLPYWQIYCFTLLIIRFDVLLSLHYALKSEVSVIKTISYCHVDVTKFADRHSHYP